MSELPTKYEQNNRQLHIREAYVAALEQRVADLTVERDALRTHAEMLTQAIRWTQEYVGDELLPPLSGWSWFDALIKQAELTEAEGEMRSLRQRADGWSNSVPSQREGNQGSVGMPETPAKPVASARDSGRTGESWEEILGSHTDDCPCDWCAQDR